MLSVGIRITHYLDSLYWKVSRGTVLVLIFVLNTGFVKAPFARWTGGRITHLDAANRTLTLLDPNGKTEKFFWSKDTLFWNEPTRRRDRGAVFEPKDVEVGSEVRVMFKKIGAGKQLTKVIRNGDWAERSKTI